MRNETMTSRQRVKNTIEQKPTDRVPIDFGMHFSTGISAFGYYNLRKYLNLNVDDIEIVDCNQLLARVDQDVLERFHVDTILLNPPLTSHRVWNPRGDYRFKVPHSFKPELQSDGSYLLRKKRLRGIMPQNGFFFDYSEGLGYDPYEIDIDEKIEFFGQRAERLYKETDKFTLLMGFPSYFTNLDFACEMLLNPKDCKDYNENVLNDAIIYFNKINKRYGEYLGAIEVNGDLGTQNAPMCSPSSYEDICYPYLKRFCKHVHEASDIKIFLHSCGSIYRLLPYIIDAGVDIINPVQISAQDMKPQLLKQEFGDKICFWGGGCDTQYILWKETPEKITNHVKENMEIFKPGGGFVFNQVHNVMGNVPPENVVAMFDAAYNNSFY